MTGTTTAPTTPATPATRVQTPAIDTAATPAAAHAWIRRAQRNTTRAGSVTGSVRGLVTAAALAGGLLTGCGHSAGSAPSAAPAAASGGSAASATAGAGCQQVGTVSFDKTKFVLHAGLAFGAFHHFIYNPLHAGQLHGAGPLVKAGLAGLFTVHELRLAKTDAESSPTLCHLVAPFDQAATGLSGLVDKIKGGAVNPADVAKIDGQVNSLQAGAAAGGAPAPDRIPSDTQLASGGA